MDKKKSVDILERKIVRMKDHLANNVDLIALAKLERDTNVAISKIFGEEGYHLRDFKNVFPDILNCTNETYIKNGISETIAIIQSMIDEISEYGMPEETIVTRNNIPLKDITLLCDRFHLITRQLRDRYSGRNTLDIEDEYDVQDLMHSLLHIYFDDIRPEEWTPSYAGASSRVDFLLKNEKIVIEIKKTRIGLDKKKLGEELIIDIARYKTHPDCKSLVCFVYDPDGRVANPRGLEGDLSKIHDGLDVKVFIRP